MRVCGPWEGWGSKCMEKLTASGRCAHQRSCQVVSVWSLQRFSAGRPGGTVTAAAGGALLPEPPACPQVGRCGLPVGCAGAHLSHRLPSLCSERTPGVPGAPPARARRPGPADDAESQLPLHARVGPSGLCRPSSSPGHFWARLCLRRGGSVSAEFPTLLPSPRPPGLSAPGAAAGRSPASRPGVSRGCVCGTEGQGLRPQDSLASR